MSTEISLPDYLSLQSLIHDWAQSYDTKDWPLLRTCLAPSVTLDFTGLGGPLHKDLTPDDYVAILSSPKLLGNPLLKTQHLLGASKWEITSDVRVHAWHQARVAHQRYTDETFSTVANKGHGHGIVEHWYTKIDSVWKIEASKSSSDWSEYDLWGTVDPSAGAAEN